MNGPGPWPASLALLLVLLAGCGRGHKLPVYQDEQGFHFTPPPGWVERARPAAGAAPAPRRGSALPLPPLGVPGGGAERLMVRYDRPPVGRYAWLRVTSADVPASLSLEACLEERGPGADWQREGNVQGLEVSGLQAARVAFRGRWDNQDYLNETVVVRKGERAYFITASFPAADTAAAEQVRQAVAGTSWR